MVLIVGDSLQLFTITFPTDSMHELKACKKENSEASFAFNGDEGQFGEFRRSHTHISQESEETPATSASFFVQDSVLRLFHASENVCETYMESREGNFV